MQNAKLSGTACGIYNAIANKKLTKHKKPCFQQIGNKAFNIQKYSCFYKIYLICYLLTATSIINA